MSKLQRATQAFKQLTTSLTRPVPVIEITFDSHVRNQNLSESQDNSENSSDNIKDDVKHLRPVYHPGDSITGTINIILIENMKDFEYEEISVYLIGQVQCSQINKDYTFFSNKLSLAKGPNKLISSIQFDFAFDKPKLDYSSFYGSIVKSRYFIRVEIQRPGMHLLSIANIQKERDLIIIHPIKNKNNYPKPKSVHMQVGVDDCLHIKFYYENINLDTNGCLKGEIKILSNTLKIHSMQIQFLRREIVKTGLSNNPEIVNTDIIGKFELMDGAPGDNELIPVRLFLGRFKRLGPTLSNKFFSARYYANLGLVDRDGRRYFKTVELSIWSKKRM